MQNCKYKEVAHVGLKAQPDFFFSPLFMLVRLCAVGPLPWRDGDKYEW